MRHGLEGGDRMAEQGIGRVSGPICWNAQRAGQQTMGASSSGRVSLSTAPARGLPGIVRPDSGRVISKTQLGSHAIDGLAPRNSRPPTYLGEPSPLPAEGQPSTEWCVRPRDPSPRVLAWRLPSPSLHEETQSGGIAPALSAGLPPHACPRPPISPAASYLPSTRADHPPRRKLLPIGRPVKP
jgi:hypothetical protein